MKTYALHIVVTRKIFKKVTKTIFPNKTPEIPAPALRKRQFIRRCEQKINAIFFCVTAEIFRTVSVGAT